MKIVNTVLGDATGGRWQVVLDYAEVLRDLGHEVTLLVNRKKVNSATVFPQGINVELIANSGHYDIIATLKAVSRLRKIKPDLIIAHCGRSIALMKRAAGRTPVVGVSHSNNVKRTVPADAYINISTFIADEIIRLGGSGKPAFHIPNMVKFSDDVEWVPREWRTPPVIGAFGRMDPVKGLHILINAASELRDQGVNFSLKVGGAGIQEEELRQQVMDLQLNDRVEFVGWVNNTKAFFDSIDIICIPALSDAFGLTPIESAIASTPQVLSTATGHLDMYEEGISAHYAEKGNAKDLAVALASAINNPDNCRKMSERAFDVAKKRYNRAALVRNLDELVTALTS